MRKHLSHIFCEGGFFVIVGTCLGACIHGIDGALVDVEVDVAPGVPQFSIVGLPDVAVRESVDRVRAALKNEQFRFPMGRVTVNLAPADVRKEGAALDVAIAVGILRTTGQWDDAGDAVFIGELSLRGEVRPVCGVLPMLLAARNRGVHTAYVPEANEAEAMLVTNMRIVPLRTLRDVVLPHRTVVGDGVQVQEEQPLDCGDYGEVQGLHTVKRAIVIAVAGNHHLLLIGPPGAGKTMLMRRLPSVLPPLEEDEALDVMRISSALGIDPLGRRRRPFRMPHHTISAQGLVGGGSKPSLGEASLAHRGVLFLDECAEYRRSTLDCLRQPLEEGCITIARVRATVTFPTQFMLAATMNPCPCGYDGYEDRTRICTCTERMKRKYIGHLSGPMLDRLDMHIDVPRLRSHDVRRPIVTRTSAEMKADIVRAQSFGYARNAAYGVRANAHIPSHILPIVCPLSDAVREVLLQAMETMGLSPRAHDRLIKIARTIADIEGSAHIDVPHMQEALFTRALDRRLGQLHAT
ncbi:MAG: YifB family Mg chelatase-like AAA ATPase [Paenibacillaceae bacterium]|nr:YifB family Mg chelatase-like AAA ATPase [Paenibacillaceae bacterium]